VPKVSVTIITKNEAGNIEAALASVAWADERIVVDAESTDDTVSRAQSLANRVTIRRWAGYGTQKNYAANLARHDWILSLDADERITPALAAEIRALPDSPSPAGYRMPRATHHLGRWIRSTDWYPDYQLRLYDRRRARWSEPPVHESVQADGDIATLGKEIEHYPYRDIAHHHQTIDRYTTLAAEGMHGRGRRASAADLVLHPPAAFLRNYILRGGIRDGVPGLIVSAMNSYYVFLKFAKLWELERRMARVKRDGAS
jgi:(heptosyl)LPS beta-1,4-glucosyltransferase